MPEMQQHFAFNLRVLTYNVFLRPPPIKTNADDYKEERFRDILSVIDRFDIVCFQELFQTATFRSEDIIEFAISRGFMYWKIGEAPNFCVGPIVDSGLLILSKYPIIFAHFYSYNIGILSDSASDKGYIYCKIKVPAKTSHSLHLFSTHLQASYAGQDYELQKELSVKVRLEQCKILFQSIKVLLSQNGYSPKDLVLLAGDININAREIPFRLMPNSILGNFAQSFPEMEAGNSVVNGLLTQKTFCEYSAFLSILQSQQLSVIDFAKQSFGEHPVTFGNGETVLSGAEQANSKQRLDYIYQIVLGTHNPSEATLQARTESARVERFEVEERRYKQLSDHLGLSIELHSVLE